MKIFRLLISSVLLFSCCVCPIARGQGIHDKMKGRHRAENRWSVLPPAEREKMKAAHEKAMPDPSVQRAKKNLRQARREYRSAVNAAMIKADPSVEPILRKLKAERHPANEED